MKATKKPVEIEAMQFGITFEQDIQLTTWMGKNLYPFLVGNANDPDSLRYPDQAEGDDSKPDKGKWIDPATGNLMIRTLEGDMRVGLGDWVIKGVQGEFYPCKEDIFNETYDYPKIEDRSIRPLRKEDRAEENTSGEEKSYDFRGYKTTFTPDATITEEKISADKVQVRDLKDGDSYTVGEGTIISAKNFSEGTLHAADFSENSIQVNGFHIADMTTCETCGAIKPINAACPSGCINYNSYKFVNEGLVVEVPASQPDVVTIATPSLKVSTDKDGYITVQPIYEEDTEMSVTEEQREEQELDYRVIYNNGWEQGQEALVPNIKTQKEHITRLQETIKELIRERDDALTTKNAHRSEVKRLTKELETVLEQVTKPSTDTETNPQSNTQAGSDTQTAQDLDRIEREGETND